ERDGGPDTCRRAERRDQDPHHRSTIITPRLLMPERCLAKPGKRKPKTSYREACLPGPEPGCVPFRGTKSASYNAPAWEDGNMERTLYIASGLSVLVTTVTFGHNMYRTMAHLVTYHGQSFSNPFFAVHTILAAVTGVLSLIGAYFLLTGWRQQNPN